MELATCVEYIFLPVPHFPSALEYVAIVRVWRMLHRPLWWPMGPWGFTRELTRFME